MATKRELRQRWKVEPGATIRKQVLDYKLSTHKWDPNAAPEENYVNQTLDSQEIFRLLDGLPFRDEVPSRRDLRGSDFAGGWRSDFSETDFSYSTSCGDFFHCNLTRAKFAECATDRKVFENTLSGANFSKAKLIGCFMQDSQAQACCFDGANIQSMAFDGTDLSGSSFRNANCKRATFCGANLLGCNFRGANLEEASFREAIIDKSTDFRGASLINADYEDSFDNAGNLTAHGVDLRQATYDETTKFGVDPLAFPLEWQQRAIEIATSRYGSEGQRMAAFFQRMKDQMLSHGERSIDWENEQIAALAPQDRALYEEIMDETFRSLR